MKDTGQTGDYAITVGEDSDTTINAPVLIKMDAQGLYLADSATAWAMVYDTASGLIWEVKTDDGSIRDRDYVYDFSDAQAVYIAGLNAADFGGLTGWRLPTVRELMTLVHRDRMDPASDSAYFPLTAADGYWTSTANSVYTYEAWQVDFATGAVGSENKTVTYRVRAVYGTKRSQHGFVDNSDGTVTDTKTGLMWQQSDSGSAVNWNAAIYECETATLAGFEDWRLPTVNELQTLANYTLSGPAADTAFLPSTISGAYASSTSNADDGAQAWAVDFSDGSVAGSDKTGGFYVRAVRGGQSRVEGNLLIASPVQGAVLRVGEVVSFQWDTAGIAGNVSITLSRDGGATFETLAADTTNSGQFDWTVTSPETSNAMIRIEPVADAGMGTTVGLMSISATMPPAAVVSGAPEGTVKQTGATIVVGGDAVTHYKYKMDTGGFGDETPVDTNITLSGLADGGHVLYVIGKNSYGDWQAEAEATTASWTVDATAPDAPVAMDLAAEDDTGIDVDNITGQETLLSISGAGENDATIQLYDNEIAISGATAARWPTAPIPMLRNPTWHFRNQPAAYRIPAS